MKKTLRTFATLLMLSVFSFAQAGWIQLTNLTNTSWYPPNEYEMPPLLAANSTYLFATIINVGQKSGWLKRSGDQGASWANITPPGDDYYALAANDAHLFVASGQMPNIYRSGDNGSNWTDFGQLPYISGQSNVASALAIRGNYLFATTYSGKYYKRPLYELTGITPTAAAAANIASIAFDAGWSVSAGDLGYRLDVATDAAFTTFVDGYNNKDVGNVTVFRVTGLSAATTYYYRMRAYNIHGTSENSNTVTLQTSAPSAVAPNTLPAETGLYSNYPNPFNPTTTIDYDLAKNGTVKLSVYNSTGEQVKTLVNSTQNSGRYSVNFDGAGLNSGTYFYQLKVDGKCMVNKMLMVK